MAEIQTDSVGSILKRTNLIIIGLIVGVLGLILLFSFVDFGNLFGGFTGVDPDAQEEEPDNEEAALPAPEFATTLVDSEVIFENNELLSFSYIIDQSGFVIFRIFDEENIEVHSFSDTELVANELITTTWDGKLENGTLIQPGTYTYVMVPENNTGIGNGSSGTFLVLVPEIPQENPEENEEVIASSDSAPPTLQGPVLIQENSTTDEEEEIEIIDHSVFPLSFNPNLNEVKIEYEISADAVIEVEILDSTGDTVVTLTDNENQDQGEHFVWWNGTDEVDNDGDVVSSGSYEYHIIARDSFGDIADTATGGIQAVYAQPADFEDTTEEVITAPSPTPVASTVTAQNNAAIIAMQNSTSGVTAGTGPSTLFYLLFPLSGYFIYRKRN